MADDERDRIICVLVADLADPTDGSIPEWCELCAESVWLSSEGQRHRWDRPTMVICIDCAGGEIETHPSSPIEAIPGAREYHLRKGMTEAEFDRIRRLAIARMRGRRRG